MNRISVLVALALSASAARAHHPGFSSLSVQVREDAVAVHLALARVDTERLYPLDTNKDGAVSTGELEAARLILEEVALAFVELTAGSRPLAADNPSVRVDEVGAINFEFQFYDPPEGDLRLRSAVLAKLPGEHRQHLAIYDEQRALLGAWLLDRTQDSVDLPRRVDARQPARTGFVDFLKLGVEHIVTGYDHIVFLLGLLVIGGRFVGAVKIITAFTVAHSMTLALVTLDFVRIPSGVVEPLIAASIIYVGLENIFRQKLEGRWMLAFGFGLIHGCGFATVLRELGVGTGGGGVLMPLLAFNLGVEAGQIAIAAIVLPVIWNLKELAAWRPKYVPALSVAIVLAGGYWLVDRLIGPAA